MSQCDRGRLQLAIENRLGAFQELDLSRHLQSCPHCRHELEELAGSQECWDNIRTYLSSSDELLAIDDRRTAPLMPSDIQTPSAAGRQCDTSLDFLTPSDDPQMLGRLGKYDIERVIGRGGMGVVLKAHDPTLNRSVAIKVMLGSLASSAAARKRFAREAQAAAAVVHDHVIPIYAVDTSGQTPYLVMPYVLGRSLQDRLDETGILETRQILRIALQIAQGLAAAHAQGLIHRDIKPANILLEDGMGRVRISDFGLARASDDASQTQSGFIAGTPQYMAPEQARGEVIDTRADLFSLGSVMYAMCTGHPPFRAETTLAVLRRICDDVPRDVCEVNPDVPRWLADVIHRLLAKLPSSRFPSADAVAQLLERWLAHLQQPNLFPAPVAAPAAPKRSRWRRSLAGAAIAGGAAIFALAGISAMQDAEAPSRTDLTERRADGLDRAALAASLAEPGPEVDSIDALGISADALRSELEGIWRETADLGLRMLPQCSTSASLLRENVWELGGRLQSLEIELGSSPLNLSLGARGVE
jgi:serine/threonine-protein kinase